MATNTIHREDRQGHEGKSGKGKDARNDVTPIGYACVFQEPRWKNAAAIAAIREFGGQ
jgi:hypothetical protein